MFKRTYNTFVRYTRNANRYYIDIILYKQLIPISLIRLIRLIGPIGLIAYYFVLFFSHHDFKYMLFWLLKDA